MSADRPHGQMIGDELHRWQGDPYSHEKRWERILAKLAQPRHRPIRLPGDQQ